MYTFLAISLVVASTIPVASGVVACRAHSQCNQEVGEVCVLRFYGCNIGACLCPEGEDTDDKGICRRRRIGNEFCTDKDVCSGRMPCVDARCHCEGQLTPDRTFCLRHNQRLLGDTCKEGDICLQQMGTRYTKNDVICRNGVCSCSSGFKQTKSACRKWDIGESGCLQHDQCHGGALCIHRKCQCPTDYNVRAGGTKCTRRNAKVDLQLGDTCSEVKEQKYCGEGLICHMCEGVHTCLRSRNNPNNPHSRLASGSEGSRQGASFLTALVLCLASVSLFTNVNCR